MISVTIFSTHYMRVTKFNYYNCVFVLFRLSKVSSGDVVNTVSQGKYQVNQKYFEYENIFFIFIDRKFI